MRNDAKMQLARGSTKQRILVYTSIFFSFDSYDNLTKENFQLFLVSICTFLLLQLLLYAEFQPFCDWAN